MAVKRLTLALCIFSFLQSSFAGFDRLGLFSKDADTQVKETWQSLSDAEQRALLERYQSLKEIPESERHSLQQRMDWFTQLPEPEKQKMRSVWQKMSTQERQELRIRMQNASLEERTTIRNEYLNQYSINVNSNLEPR